MIEYGVMIEYGKFEALRTGEQLLEFCFWRT